MIKLKLIEVINVRGIRELTIPLDSKSLVIVGPNGSGKSGVVDAIEFGLAGRVSRLSGSGTANLSLAKHGPHVGSTFASVTIRATLSDPIRDVTLTRNMSSPLVYDISPDTEENRRAIDDLREHPEIVLSRRQIIQYVLGQATDRSKAIQALLRLDRINEIRASLVTAANSTKKNRDSSRSAATTSLDSFLRHVECDAWNEDEIVRAVNEHRRVLTLPDVKEVTPETDFRSGLSERSGGAPFNRTSALSDVVALRDAFVPVTSGIRTKLHEVSEKVRSVRDDESVRRLMRQGALVRSGLELVESAFCPLCDSEWDSIEALRAHLGVKVEALAAAESTSRGVADSCRLLQDEITAILELARPVASAAVYVSADDLVAHLESFTSQLEELDSLLDSVERVVEALEIEDETALGIPSELDEGLGRLEVALTALPDDSKATSAAAFLAIAQERLSSVRTTASEASRQGVAHRAAVAAKDAWATASTSVLSAIYESVKDNFVKFYRAINSDDEGTFEAVFTQSGGKLEIDVDFYDQGKFPPAALHSEGHQDSMGVCLYLALMRQIFGSEMSFAVLDDVVMSIDREHRKRFCQLLKDEFGSTQFVITTHDPMWAELIRRQHLVEQSAVLRFSGWSLETGPQVSIVQDEWSRIDSDLATGDVHSAAAKLRRHLEHQSMEIVEGLRAKIEFRRDGDYNLGQLWGPAMNGLKEAIASAIKSASSWRNASLEGEIRIRDEARKESLTRYGDEQWAVNKMVHFSDWATMTPQEFGEVVESAKGVLDQFRCGSPSCGSWLYLRPEAGDAEMLRCDCGNVQLNLVRR